MPPRTPRSPPRSGPTSGSGGAGRGQWCSTPCTQRQSGAAQVNQPRPQGWSVIGMLQVGEGIGNGQQAGTFGLACQPVLRCRELGALALHLLQPNCVRRQPPRQQNAADGDGQHRAAARVVAGGAGKGHRGTDHRRNGVAVRERSGDYLSQSEREEGQRRKGEDCQDLLRRQRRVARTAGPRRRCAAGGRRPKTTARRRTPTRPRRAVPCKR